ncbi:MAG: hypothetical protein HKN21_06710, partial [Candidatus Eisenbacteria bacterium]|nr:hypothetical protein [Candidatus Eisenbacteria bacterium]
EEREFFELLETDPALKAEWEEMSQTRSILSKLDDTEAVPSFNFLIDEHVEPVEPARLAVVSPEPTFGERVKGWFKGFGAQPAWGMATAALVVAVLAMSDFKIQKVDGGLAFRFGDAPMTAQYQVPPSDSVVPQQGTVGLGNGVELTRASTGDTGGLVTRNELEATQSEMFRIMLSMIKDYDNHRSEKVDELMRILYSDLSTKQTQAYGELRGRIETVGIGMAVDELQKQRTEEQPKLVDPLEKN